LLFYSPKALDIHFISAGSRALIKVRRYQKEQFKGISKLSIEERLNRPSSNSISK